MFNGSRQATTLLKNAKQTEASRHALRGSYRQTRRQKIVDMCLIVEFRTCSIGTENRSSSKCS